MNVIFIFLFILFVLSTSALTLSILHMISDDEGKNLCIAIIGGMYSVGYMNSIVMLCKKKMKERYKEEIQNRVQVEPVQVEGSVNGVYVPQNIEQIEGEIN